VTSSCPLLFCSPHPALKFHNCKTCATGLFNPGSCGGAPLGMEPPLAFPCPRCAGTGDSNSILTPGFFLTPGHFGWARPSWDRRTLGLVSCGAPQRVASNLALRECYRAHLTPLEIIKFFPSDHISRFSIYDPYPIRCYP